MFLSVLCSLPWILNIYNNWTDCVQSQTNAQARWTSCHTDFTILQTTWGRLWGKQWWLIFIIISWSCAISLLPTVKKCQWINTGFYTHAKCLGHTSTSSPGLFPQKNGLDIHVGWLPFRHTDWSETTGTNQENFLADANFPTALKRSMYVWTEICITNRRNGNEIFWNGTASWGRTIPSGQKDLNWRRATLPWTKSVLFMFRPKLCFIILLLLFFLCNYCMLFWAWKMLTTEHLIWKLGVSVTGQNYIEKILT